jgi:hypothetical protein
MKAQHKRLDQLQLDNVSFPDAIFLKAYQYGRLTQDEYNWIMNCGIPFQLPYLTNDKETPERKKYHNILKKTDYLPPVEWNE